MAPFLFQPIQRLALVINGKRIASGEAIDPRPLVRLYIPHTRVSYLVAAVSPEDPNMAFGLVDEDDGFPRSKHFDLSAVADRGGEIDETFVGRYPLSHYAAVAEIAGFAIIDDGMRMPRKTGTR